MSNDEKKQLNSERQKAVRDAWKNEKERVAQGEGTRDWTPEQQNQIIEEGRVDGFEGHHMKSVSNYPDQAGKPENIQFLSESEHFDGAHQGSYHNQTNGYYNPNSGSMEEFNGNELRPVESQELSEPCYENGEEINQSANAFNASAKSTGNEVDSGQSNFNESAKQNNSSEEGHDNTGNMQSEGISR